MYKKLVEDKYTYPQGEFSIFSKKVEEFDEDICKKFLEYVCLTTKDKEFDFYSDDIT